MTRPPVLILAGGRGSRLRPLGAAVPKPMIDFMTEPLLFGWLRRLAREGFVEVHLLVGRSSGAFTPAVELARRLGLRLLVHTEERPLHSAGAIGAAVDRGALSGSVVVVNADVVSGSSLVALLRHHRRTRADATLLGVTREDTKGFGVLRTRGSRAADFREKPGGRAGPGVVNAGVYVLGRSVLATIPSAGACSLEVEILPAMLRAGARLEVVHAAGGWADVGTPRRYLHAHFAALDGEISWPWMLHRSTTSRITVHPSAAVHSGAVIHPPAAIGSGSVVASQAIIGPYTVLGRETSVGRGATVVGSVLLARAKAGPHGRLEGSVASPSTLVEVDPAGAARRWLPAPSLQR